MRYIITTLFILSSTYYSNACDCIMYPIEAYVNKVDFIFTGKVIEILYPTDIDKFIVTPNNKAFYKNKGYRVKVLIIESLKTGKLKADTLEFTSDFKNCDPLYKLDESYLFFAEMTPKGKFKMTPCTYWGTLRESKKNIAKLKAELKK